MNKDLKEKVENEIAEIAKIYSLNKNDIYYLFLEAVAYIEKANYAVFYGDGIKLIFPEKEQYLSFSKTRLRKYLDKLRNDAIKQTLYNMKLFVNNLIQKKQILFACVRDETKSYYICDLFSAKDEKINWITVFINKHNLNLSKSINYFPIKLKNYQGTQNTNNFIVKGKVFDKELVDFHFKYFIETKLHIIDDFKFKTISVFNKSGITHILVKASQKVPKSANEYIKNYFKSFGAIIRIKY